MQHLIRRSAALIAVPALALSALVASSAPASAVVDSRPSTAAADWLETQLVDGVVPYDDGTYQFDAIALTADVGFALAGHGGHEAAVDEIVTAIEPRVHDEWYTSTWEGVTTLYAGSLAKAAAFALVADADPTDFGGYDLVGMLEGTVSTTGATTGRVQDQNGEYTDVFGQAFAVQVLATMESDLADETLAFLLDQQCADGWFRLNFAARDAADQTCDGDATAVADPDATAAALTALVSLHDDALVPAIDKAESWLLSKQRKDGSWGGGPTTAGSNANSTGIIGAVLGELGDTGAAQRAAAWVRAHQLANVGGCTTYRPADLGAIAYNDKLRSSLESGIDKAARYEAQKATADALAVLPYAEGAATTHVLMSPDYVRAGGRSALGVIGAAPGEALCVKPLSSGAGRTGWADLDGEAQLAFRVPNKQGTSKVRVWNATGVLDTVQINALGKAKLKVSLKSARVAGGKNQVIKVTGLAPAEFASVRITWPSTRGGGSGEATGGQANRRGVFKLTVRVPKKPGTAKVKAAGQFKNRKGATSFTVTR